MSTQASVMNAEAARAWHDLGASRVVVAREMSMEDIAELRAQAPRDLEIEAFVHGAMCMAFSGRCMLSAAMTGRSGNKGYCAQPCRWSYALVEEKRPGAYYPIEEDVRGTYVMNAHDLCMIEHLDELAQAGVSSFKIEGRNKRAFYVTLRCMPIGRSWMAPTRPRSCPICMPFRIAPMAPASISASQANARSATATTRITCMPPRSPHAARKEGGWRIEATCHNRFREGDELEALSPRKAIETAKVRGLTWLVQPSEDRPNPSPSPCRWRIAPWKPMRSPAISHCSRAICCAFAWILLLKGRRK